MFDWIRSIFARHPSFGSLVDLATGGALHPVLAAHVDECPRCRRSLYRLRQDWERLADIDAAPDPGEEQILDEVLNRILAAIRSTTSTVGIVEKASTERCRQLAQELLALTEVCFGAYGREIVCDSESDVPDAARMLAHSESLLGTFVGRTAASAIADRMLRELRLHPS